MEQACLFRHRRNGELNLVDQEPVPRACRLECSKSVLVPHRRTYQHFDLRPALKQPPDRTGQRRDDGLVVGDISADDGIQSAPSLSLVLRKRILDAPAPTHDAGRHIVLGSIVEEVLFQRVDHAFVAICACHMVGAEVFRTEDAEEACAGAEFEDVLSCDVPCACGGRTAEVGCEVQCGFPGP